MAAKSKSTLLVDVVDVTIVVQSRGRSVAQGTIYRVSGVHPFKLDLGEAQQGDIKDLVLSWLGHTETTTQ
jgi:hypothetical protein